MYTSPQMTPTTARPTRIPTMPPVESDLGIAEALALAEEEVLDADFDAEAEALELPEAEEWDCVALALAKVLETRVVDCPVTKAAIQSSKVINSIIVLVETR